MGKTGREDAGRGDAEHDSHCAFALWMRTPPAGYVFGSSLLSALACVRPPSFSPAPHSPCSVSRGAQGPGLHPSLPCSPSLTDTHTVRPPSAVLSPSCQKAPRWLPAEQEPISWLGLRFQLLIRASGLASSAAPTC